MTQGQRLSLFERYRRLVTGRDPSRTLPKPPPADECPICGAVPVLKHTGFCESCTKGVTANG